jgi:stage II sporulation protein D
MKISKIIFLITLCCCFNLAGYTQPPHFIRVAIIQDASSLRLKVTGFYEIIAPESGEVLYRGRSLNSTVTASAQGIWIAGVNFKRKSVLIKMKDAEAVLIDDRNFRGDIRMIKKDNGNLLVVNHIDLEDYIKGILYHEASHYWPIEALKAQAVVCRTYALSQIEANVAKDFDVSSDIYSQVYGGKTSERYRTNAAVEKSAGGILLYQGRIFPTYYHATCAGFTEDAALLWDINLPPLKGVVCTFCKDSPHFYWHLDLPQSEVADKLKGAGYKIDLIKDVIILGRDKSGRIAALRIVTDKRDIEIAAKDFRNILGPNIIRSTNFMVLLAGEDMVFEGIGWGHGVGLCQWGAYFMAKKGYTYEQILKYYYPQAELSLITK